ncbi:MAG: hypothetical protein AAF989_11370 [Planctomycetota bacterium]
MDAFEQIWESSRTNDYSWGYPAVLWAGVGVLIVLSLIRHDVLRRVLKVIAMGGLVMTAMEWSSSEIEEKWRIRREWADTHPAEMTEQGYEALTVDGANRLLGPLIDGAHAGLLFVGVAIALFVIRVAIRKRSTVTLSKTTEESEAKIAANLPTTGNPYHPPADAI